MRKNLLLVLFSLFILTSCNNPLNKSIIYPLEYTELHDIISEDTGFIQTYNFVNDSSEYGFKTWQNESDINKAMCSNITYNDFHKYGNYSKELCESKDILMEIKSKYYEQYGDYKEKIDSVINYYEPIYNKTDYHNYVQFNFKNVVYNRYKYLHKTRSVILYFTMKSNTNISLQDIYYDLNDITINNCERLKNLGDVSYVNDSTLSLELSGFVISEKYINENDIKLSFDLDKLYINGKDIISEHDEIPYSVKYVLDVNHNYVEDTIDTKCIFDRDVNEKINSVYTFHYYSILDDINNYIDPSEFYTNYINNLLEEYNKELYDIYKKYFKFKVNKYL